VSIGVGIGQGVGSAVGGVSVSNNLTLKKQSFLLYVSSIFSLKLIQVCQAVFSSFSSIDQ
jgi:hypothetical protein